VLETYFDLFWIDEKHPDRFISVFIQAVRTPAYDFLCFFIRAAVAGSRWLSRAKSPGAGRECAVFHNQQPTADVSA